MLIRERPRERSVGVRFIIGRAGTGKSSLCAEEIRGAMRRDPLGGALLWITPEQGTFTTERMLLSSGQWSVVSGQKVGGGGVGTFRGQVVSFRRLAGLVGEEVGFLRSSRVRPLGDLARLVLLEETVRGVREELGVFGGVADRPGFIKRLDVTLKELRQHAHSGDSLRAIGATAGLDPLARRKFADLAVLMDAWSGVMDKEAGEAAWDGERILHTAALRAGESALVKGARVWVDGFSAMSALEIRMVVALAQHAESVTVTLLADPDSPAIRDLRCAPEDMTLFARTERLYCRLVEAFGQHKVRLLGTKWLRMGRRFENKVLKRVESELFADDVRPGKSESAGQGAFAFAGAEEAPAAVEVWECSDPETEVRVAAQAIREMLLEEEGAAALRYRHIGLIVPDLEGYQDAIARIFSEHQIPHFIDQRKTVGHHPLVELLRSAVAIETSRWDQDEILLYLKTGLASVSADDVAAVENYVIAHGITHMAWSTPWRWVAPNQAENSAEEEEAFVPEHARVMLLRANAVREQVWGVWEKSRVGLGGKGDEPAAASAYVGWLRELLAALKVEEQLGKWGAAALAAGQAEIAQMHEQVWRQSAELLGTLETSLTGRPRTLVEFARILNDALESLTLGLIPPTVDQVLVSSVTRSRVPTLKVAIILGAVEGQFPKVAEEDPILSDAQREFFNAHSLDPIGAGSERQLLEMPFFDYTAFTRASERVVVSYPIADRRGRAIVRSRYVQRLFDVLGEGVTARKFDVSSRTAIDRIGTSDDLLAAVVAWARDLRRRRETLETDANDPAMSRLYNWVVTAADGPFAAARALVWEAVGIKHAPQLAIEMAERFYPPGRELRLSVSQLEKFAACPMQYFMHYTLGLRPRAVLEMDTLNLGNLYHKILENIYREIVAGRFSAGEWPACEAATLRGALEKEVDAACEALHKELAERTPSYEKMKTRTKRVLGIMLEGERRRACAGDMRPVGVEVTFGDRGTRETAGGVGGARLVNLPVLRILTPGNHAVELNGKIDRVDAADEGKSRHVAVIDYKSASEKKLPLYLVYWGLALQLPVYALVMEALAKQQSMAAMYVPLGLKRETVKQFSDAADPASDAFYQKQKPRGVVDAESAHHLDHTVGAHEDAGGRSDWYSMAFTKEHRSNQKTDMVEHEEYRTLLEYIPWKIGRMVDDLMEGHIGPAPYRDKNQVPCEECDFASLCPFDRISGVYRDVPKMTRAAAFSRMRADVAETAGGAS